MSPHPGGFFVVEIYFILWPQHGLGGRMAWIFDTLLWTYGPGFHNLPSFLQLSLVSLFSSSSFLEAFRESFILAAPEKLSIYCRLFALISWWTWSSPFFIFLVFFGIFSCLDLPGYAFYDFFSIIWGAGVCFWRVFQSTLKKWKWCGQIFKTRATRARRART